MENRFGIKDFFLFLLLIVLIVFVVLAMVQYDRQWEVMQQISQRVSEQTTDLAQIHRLLSQGVPTAATASGSGNPTANPMAGFERIVKAQSAPDYAQGGQLVMLSQATSAKITPLISNEQGAATVQSYVMDSLVNRDPDTLAWTPNLATSWKISDDGLKIDFNLRQGVTFSDGSPLTADDVVYTFDMVQDPNVADPGMKSVTDRLDHVEKTGDFSVRFIFKEPYFKSFDVAGGTPIMSKAFYSKYSITDFNRSTGLLIGSGPYRMLDPTSWRPAPGQPFVLVRNERYWGPTPSFDRIIWNIIEQPSARVTAFRNGEVDVMGGDGPPTPEQFSQMVGDTNLLAQTQHWALTVPTEAWYYLGWNEKQGRDGPPTPFADPRVRRALTMLTDRNAILQTIIHGYGEIITSPFTPNTPQCDPSIEPWPYDPAAAEKLLIEAGFHRDGDRMIGPDGKPFAFEVMYNTNSEPRRRIASYLHDAYAKAGIQATPKNEEWSIFLQRMDQRNFDVIIGSWGSDLEADPYEQLDTSQIAKTGQNCIQFSDPKLDALIAQARSTLDDGKRMLLWHQVHQLIHQDEPYTYIMKYKELDFVRNRIHGAAPTKVLGLNPTAEWYIPKALQTAQ